MIRNLLTPAARKTRVNRMARILALECLEGRKLLSTTTVELPNGTVDVSTFDQAGHLTAFSSTDPSGVVQYSQSQHFNQAGALTSQENDFGPALGSATEIRSFSAATGRETSETTTYADGSMTTATFNASGMETSSAAFDASGNLASQQSYIYSPTGAFSKVTSTNTDGSGYSASFYADGHASSWTTFQADGTSQTTNYRDITTGTWADLIE